MIPSPICRALSSIQRHHVRALLMGGQACVFYGAAEFSRDADFAILASPANLTRLRRALEELRARVIAVPPFAAAYLERGHAVHFRCEDPEAAGLRIDVMTRMRGVAPFAGLWKRRTSLELPDGTRAELMALPDLVYAKKTQRDKDWPMLRRLVEAHYFQKPRAPDAAQVVFWLREARTPELLVEVARRWPAACARQSRRRPLLALASAARPTELAAALDAEEKAERAADADYWRPLKAELERLRHARPSPP